MSTRDPAFPVSHGTGSAYYAHPGMTLRDYFAGQVAGQVLATATGVKIDAKIIAQGAYLIADAMLAERSKS